MWNPLKGQLKNKSVQSNGGYIQYTWSWWSEVLFQGNNRSWYSEAGISVVRKNCAVFLKDSLLGWNGLLSEVLWLLLCFPLHSVDFSIIFLYLGYCLLKWRNSVMKVLLKSLGWNMSVKCRQLLTTVSKQTKTLRIGHPTLHKML